MFEHVEPSYDTFIFFVEDNILKKLIVNHIKNIGFGTKNLPDALRWHCFYYWDHILPNDQKDHLNKLIQFQISRKIALLASLYNYKAAFPWSRKYLWLLFSQNFLHDIRKF